MNWKPQSGLIGFNESLATVQHLELGEIEIRKSPHDHSIHIYRAGNSDARHVVTLRDLVEDYLEQVHGE